MLFRIFKLKQPFYGQVSKFQFQTVKSALLSVTISWVQVRIGKDDIIINYSLYYGHNYGVVYITLIFPITPFF